MLYKHKKLANTTTMLLLLFAVAISGFAQKTPKAIFIIADGIPADVIERIDPPALKAISKQGGYTRAYVGGEKDGYSQTPTISAVGYNSLLTGTWVNKHNVWDNDIAAPNYNYWNIYRFLKTQYPKKTTAVFSTWLDNRTKLVGSDSAKVGNLHPDFYFDGMELDTVLYPHDTAGYFYHLIDEAVTDTTVSYIKRVAPDLSWVYLEYTDEMGHRHGNSKQMDDAVVKIDKQIGKIWQAIQYREKNFNEEWQIWITTDHGREENGYGHGGQSQRERTTWIVTNAKGLNERFKKQPGIVDIMPSMATFLKINIPKERLMEIDGVSLTGKLSATDAKTSIKNNSLEIKWNVINKEGKAKIWMTSTNNFKTGGHDNYKLVAEVPVAGGKAIVDTKQTPSNFYKIVIEMPYNILNRWILVK
ncbi:MAG TPA: alkaline phosphatase family protein [Chitinophagaceae bacterium]|nr:alkaline phosphatase family protein [Chitinophagaceae bacterium]